MKTVAKAIEENQGWNIYLEETGIVDKAKGFAESYRLVMPDEETLKFPDSILRKKTGLVIKWPVNPHATGETGILSALSQTGLNVTCLGYAMDQDRRWFKR